MTKRSRLSHRPGLKARFNYALDKFMSRGGLSVFLTLLLLFALAFIFMSLLRFGVNTLAPEEGYTVWDQMWRVFLQISDSGAVMEESSMNIFHKAAGIVTTILGLVLFSSLVAFITSQFQRKVNELRKGRSRVIERGHTLILGFNDRALEIIRELVIANESERRASIVVLAEAEKDVMDDFFRERIPDLKTTRIITRFGSTSSVQALRNVSLMEAKSIIILNSAVANAPRDDKALADARIIKTIMAVKSCIKDAVMPHLVAELYLMSSRALARKIAKRVSIVEENRILARLIVQTSRTPGLAQVYNQLVGFDGNEFYFVQPEAALVGKTLRELQYWYQNATVIGYRNEDGNISINPSCHTVLGIGQDLLLLTLDNAGIQWKQQSVPKDAGVCEDAVPAPDIVERQLIVGWSIKCEIIVEEYCKYLYPGSQVTVIVPHVSESMCSSVTGIKARHNNFDITIEAVDIHDSEQMLALHPEQYDNIIILKADGGVAELRDSQTIATLLEFRHYFETLALSDNNTQLITEVADGDNIDVIQAVGVHDFFISNKLISRIYAQVSEDPSMLVVYNELFNVEGNEIYIKPLERYCVGKPGPQSFADICTMAYHRNETCIGVRLFADSMNPDSNYGIYLNPPKDRVYSLCSRDQLVVIAEEED